MPEKISAVLIVKNEALVLEQCIRSLGPIDEVVVYDTGSIDGTLEMAPGLGAMAVKGHPATPFHFADARNAADEHASHPWILTIDADEILRAGSLAKIRKAVNNAGETTAFMVTFLNRAETGSSRTIPTQKIKIHRKDAWSWQYRVHERLKSVKPGKVSILPDVVMEHMPQPDKARRHGQNVELLKMCVQESPEYTRAFRQLGLELMLDKRPEEALPYLYHYVEKTEEDRFQKSQAMCHIGECLAGADRLNEALKWFDRASEAAPERRDPMYDAAIALIKACRLEEAVGWIERMKAVPPEIRRHDLPYDLPKLWGDEPDRMLRFCREEIARAKQALKK